MNGVSMRGSGIDGVDYSGVFFCSTCETEYDLDGATDDYKITAYAECPKCKTVLETEVPSKEQLRADYWADFDPNN